MATVSSTPSLPAADGYRVWARTYDAEANPMLSLEQRVLEPLLPPLTGLDVVDLGCGTGRWLEAMREARAGSLTGVDASGEMLARATAKLGRAARLVHADCTEAKLPIASADLVLASFVLSYVADAQSFLDTVKRLLRPEGSFFLTDVHPETTRVLNWSRGAGRGKEFREIQTHRRTLSQVRLLCERAGWKACLFLEPRFGEEERLIFLQHGKAEYFDRISEYPAIYVLQLIPAEVATTRITARADSDSISEICGGRIALSAQDTVHAEIQIREERIVELSTESDPAPSTKWPGTSLDLQGFLVLPGLVNAHDHLEFALYPRLGKGGYANFLEWAQDIYHPGEPPVAKHRQVPRDVRLWWGGIRNLLCGVTAVCHHNPYESQVFTAEFPVRVLKEFGWAHSFAFDPAVSRRKQETPAGCPFFVHLAEGVDQRSAGEIHELSRAKALDPHTVVIHGLGMDEQGRALFQASGAGLVWCPSSNMFLFGETLSAETVRTFPRVALGSDSPLTAQGDLLDEIRFAHQILQTPASELYGYVTRQPADLMNLKNGEGIIRAGGIADLIAVRDTGRTPADTLAALSYKDVELVLLGGKVQLASAALLGRISSEARKGLQPLSIAGVRRWVRAPMEKLFAETAMHLGSAFCLGGKEVRFGMVY